MKLAILVAILFVSPVSWAQTDLELRKKREAQEFWDHFSREMENPSQITKLDCRRADKIDSLLTLIPRLRNLEWLNLWGLGLDSIPDFFDSIPKLTWFDAGKNQLKELPPSFNRLTQLSEVGLYSNQLQSIPEVLLKSELTSLQIQGNAIGGEFVCSPKWTEMTYLNIGHNNFDHIEGLNYLRKIEILSLRSNRFKEFPDAFQRCRRLTTVYLDFNPVAAIPRTLLSRPRLRYILIEGTSIPDELLMKYHSRYPNVVLDACPTC